VPTAQILPPEWEKKKDLSGEYRAIIGRYLPPGPWMQRRVRALQFGSVVTRTQTDKWSGAKWYSAGQSRPARYRKGSTTRPVWAYAPSAAVEAGQYEECALGHVGELLAFQVNPADLGKQRIKADS